MLGTETIRKAKHNRGQGGPASSCERKSDRAEWTRKTICVRVCGIELNFISYKEQLKLFDVIKEYFRKINSVNLDVEWERTESVRPVIRKKKL